MVSTSYGGAFKLIHLGYSSKTSQLGVQYLASWLTLNGQMADMRIGQPEYP